MRISNIVVSSDAPDQARVNGKQAKGRKADGDEDQVWHNKLPGLIRPALCRRSSSSLDPEGGLPA